jgi:hypothetical protein
MLTNGETKNTMKQPDNSFMVSLWEEKKVVRDEKGKRTGA